jgi:hypothetical protein
MEHAKALLVSENPTSVEVEWNDQPWCYSYVFGTLARANLTCMRLTTLGLFVVAAAWLAGVLVRRLGAVAAFVAIASLVSWSGVPSLSVSAMCEIPAFSLMMLTGMLVLAHEKSVGRTWLYPLAGVLAGVALAIKLTAVLLIPFVAWVVISEQSDDGFRSVGQRICRRLLPFTLFASITFIVCLLPGDSLQGHFLEPHLKSSLVDKVRKIGPTLEDFLPAAGTCLFALAGLIFVRGGSSSRLVVATGLSLLFMVAVHSVHRPFWWFYRVHFAFPLSVLAGIGAAACIPTSGLWPGIRAFRLLFGLSAGCLFVTTNLPEFWTAFSRESQAPRANEDGMLARISSLGVHDGYGFSYHHILLSRAGRLRVPGLAIVSMKRFWSGDCSDALIFDTVKKFRPVLLVVAEEDANKELWRQWLADGYVRTYASAGDALYVRKDLNPVPEVMTIDQIRRMGL